MAEHDFDYLSELCKGCGIAYMHALERNEVEGICPENDARAWLLSRHRISALVDPVLEMLGFAEPEKPH